MISICESVGTAELRTDNQKIEGTLFVETDYRADRSPQRVYTWFLGNNEGVVPQRILQIDTYKKNGERSVCIIEPDAQEAFAFNGLHGFAVHGGSVTALGGECYDALLAQTGPADFVLKRDEQFCRGICLAGCFRLSIDGRSFACVRVVTASDHGDWEHVNEHYLTEDGRLLLEREFAYWHDGKADAERIMDGDTVMLNGSPFDHTRDIISALMLDVEERARVGQETSVVLS